ncbi:MAG: hypothetical protein HLUCCA08_04140 [Rhodobacteraceae bacterium HLUCCA08]|nr:MAG: hypothetical protein HLUCCA08_04140 [Rhodobacteraceae bacterium HLUCCA08]
MKRTLWAAAVGLAASAAQANPPLGDVAHVREGLILAAMVDEITGNCPDLKVRVIRGLNFLQGLERHARDLGYSPAEIDAYIDDEVEEARLRAIGSGRLQALGADPEDPASYCTVGRAQMQAGTELGRFLR